jgi:hypothetical protein
MHSSRYAKQEGRALPDPQHGLLVLFVRKLAIGKKCWAEESPQRLCLSHGSLVELDASAPLLLESGLLNPC